MTEPIYVRLEFSAPVSESDLPSVADQTQVEDALEESMRRRPSQDSMVEPVKRQRRAIMLPRQTSASKVQDKITRTVSTKKSVDSMIKDMERKLATVQTEVADGFNKLERKI